MYVRYVICAVTDPPRQGRASVGRMRAQVFQELPRSVSSGLYLGGSSHITLQLRVSVQLVPVAEARTYVCRYVCMYELSHCSQRRFPGNLAEANG